MLKGPVLLGGQGGSVGDLPALPMLIAAGAYNEFPIGLRSWGHPGRLKLQRGSPCISQALLSSLFSLPE